MLGGDIRNLNNKMLELVKNKDLIRINQDEEGRPAFCTTGSREAKSFVKLLSDNEIAVLLVNFGESDAHVEFYFENIGIPAASGYGLEMRDVFTGKNLGVKKEFMLPQDRRSRLRMLHLQAGEVTWNTVFRVKKS